MSEAHKAMTTLFLVMFVLVLLELIQWLPSSCYLEFPLQSCGYMSGAKCSTHKPQHTASPLFISRALNGIYTHARFIFLSFLERSMQWNRRGRLLHAQGLQQVQKRLQVLAKFRDSLQSQGAGNLIDVFVWNPRSQFLYLYLLHWLTKGYLWYKMTSVSETFQRLFAVKDDCCQCMWLLF